MMMRTLLVGSLGAAAGFMASAPLAVNSQRATVTRTASAPKMMPKFLKGSQPTLHMAALRNACDVTVLRSPATLFGDPSQR